MGLYMSTLSQFMPGGKPRQVTTYTSGSGTYTPVAPNSWCRITLIGGGGYGSGAQGCYSSSYGAAGVAGQWLQQWTKVVSTASYAVGGGGYWTNSGYPHYQVQTGPGAGNTSFNGITAAAGASHNFNAGLYGYSGYIPGALGIYNHGSSYGRAGGGAAASNPNGCSPYYAGGNGTGGFILVEDFGP